ncbi:MAG: hypothetical protein EA401_07615 [Planctomycetota bacterium]|nr:MAG: hypothetical protein EA401_07615 [Planctomycetota bacterium]
MQMHRAVLSLSLLGVAATASGLEFGPVGPRSVGMGGASVATSEDGLMQQHNPAFLADSPRSGMIRSGRYGLNLVDASVSAAMVGDIGDYFDLLADIDIDTLSMKDEIEDWTDEDIEDILAIAAALAGVERPGNGILISANAGSSLRLGRFAIGARVRGQASLWVDEIDRERLGFIDNGDINDAIGNARDGDSRFNSGSHQIGTLNPDQTSRLNDILDGNSDNVSYIDYLLGNLIDDGVVRRSDLDDAIDVISDFAEQFALESDGSNDFDNNQSRVTARGIGIAEVPISYGREINDMFAVGITLRLMMGRVYGTSVYVFDDDNDEAIQEIDSNWNESFNATVDVGVRAQVTPLLTLAAVGRNLTRPKFEGFDQEVLINGQEVGLRVPDITLDPQITVGAALSLPTRLTLTAEVDVLKTESMLPGYDNQFVRAGVEWDPIRFIPLRAGVSRNIAESSEDFSVHAGLGLNFWLARLDLAGHYSIGDTVTYDGDKYPQRAGVSLGISAGF